MQRFSIQQDVPDSIAFENYKIRLGLNEHHVILPKDRRFSPGPRHREITSKIEGKTHTLYVFVYPWQNKRPANYALASVLQQKMLRAGY